MNKTFSIMSRKSALLALCRKIYETMSYDEKNSMLDNYFSLKETDSTWWLIDEKLKTLLKPKERPDFYSEEYKNLVLAGIFSEMEGIENEWILEKLKEIGFPVDALSSTPKQMFLCRCCLHYSLPTGIGWEICPVCNWEDDVEDEGIVSPTNRTTLSQERKKWINFHDRRYKKLKSI